MPDFRPARLLLSTTATLAAGAFVVTSSSAPEAPSAVRDVVVSVGPGPARPADSAGAGQPDPTQQAAHHPQQRRVLTAGAIDRLDLPAPAAVAYRSAAAVLADADADCGLSWPLLAAIARVESDHGRGGGAVLGSDGASTPLIRGVALDGTGHLARVRDSDAGKIDGDARWDRAVGPFQFLPATWSRVGVDADGDGVRSADDLDDAALGAAVFLCAAPDGLDTVPGRRAALLRLNPSEAYVRDVLAAERAYRAGRYLTPQAPTYDEQPVQVRAAAPQPSPDEPGSGVRPGTDPAEPGDQQASAGPVTHPGAGQVGSSPDPEPTRELTGTLLDCGTEEQPAWCIDDVTLDVGDPERLAATARADFDGDGTVETNADELTGLEGTEVTLRVSEPRSADQAPALLAIGGAAYSAED